MWKAMDVLVAFHDEEDRAAFIEYAVTLRGHRNGRTGNGGIQPIGCGYRDRNVDPDRNHDSICSLIFRAHRPSGEIYSPGVAIQLACGV